MRNPIDYQYTKLLKDVIEGGNPRETRAGLTRSLFGRSIRIDLGDGFPLLTTKKVFYKGIIHELLWFLKGDTNIKYLIDNGVHIWTDDAYRWFKSIEWPEKVYLEGILTIDTGILKNMTKEQFVAHVEETLYDEKGDFIYKFGDLGKIYGYQWKRGDQINRIIKTIKENPNDRRLILSAWNPDDLEEMALPPCHVMCQFYVQDGKISCMFNMRSNDICCGLPYNIAQYALLTHLIAHVTNLDVGELIYNGGDVHIYENHVEAAKEQITRKTYPLPKLELNKNIKTLEDFTYEDIVIKNYESCPPIKYQLNVG